MKIYITFVNLYIDIRLVAYLNGVWWAGCSVCIDEHSHTTIYCGTVVAFDVGIVVTCD